MNSTRPTRITRWRASAIHLMASACLALIAGLIIFGVWFPQPYAKAAGADRLITVLVGIDLVLGPLLTLIVYKHGKRGMTFDLCFIAAVRLAALIYGVNMISGSRPVFVVVTSDMTYLTSASVISDADLALGAEPQFRRRSLTGPKLVAAPPPTSAKDREELLDSGLAGRDINVQPKFFREFQTAAKPLILASPPLQLLRDDAVAQTQVDAFVDQHGGSIARMHFQPLRSNDPGKDITIVFDGETGSVLGVLEVDPWRVIEVNKK